MTEDEHEQLIEKRSKIVQHPSASLSPVSTLASALGLAQSGVMRDCCIMWTDSSGNYHIGWCDMSNAELSAYATVLQHVAANRLLEFKPPDVEASHGG